MKTENFSCYSKICIESIEKIFKETFLPISSNEKEKVFDLNDWKPACFPEDSEISNGTLIVNIENVSIGKRKIVKLIKNNDLYFSSYDEEKFLFMKFGVFNGYLKAIQGQTYKATILVGDFWLWSQGLVISSGCGDLCSLTVSGNQLTIQNPQISEYSLKLSVLNQTYYYNFNLEFIESNNFSLSINLSTIYPVSTQVLIIEFNDDNYPLADMHYCQTNKGIIYINDSIFLFLPVAERILLEVNCTNIGGNQFYIRENVFINNDPVLSYNEKVKAWQSYLILLSLDVTDLDNDLVVIFSDIWDVNGSVISYTADSIGMFCGNVSLYDGFSNLSYEICIDVIEPPEIFNLSESCIANQLCMINTTWLTDDIQVQNHSTSDKFLYWVPYYSGNFTFELLLNSEISKISTDFYSFVSEKLELVVLPSIFGNCLTEFEGLINSTNYNPPFNLKSNQNLTFINESFKIIIQEFNQISIVAEKEANFASFHFDFICSEPESIENMSVAAIFNQSLKYSLPQTKFSQYFSEEPAVQVDSINGFFIWEFPDESQSFKIFSRDPRFSDQIFYINIKVTKPAEIDPISPNQLLFYSTFESSITISYTSSINSIIEYDTNYFFGSVSSNTTTLNINLTEPSSLLLSYFKITEPETATQGYSETIYFFLFSVFDFSSPVLAELSFPCQVGKTYKLNLKNSKT